MDHHHLGYDPVEAARVRWVNQGWERAALGMAAVVSIMRAEQIFLRRTTAALRPLGLSFARYQVLGMLRWTSALTLGTLGNRLWITPATVTSAVNRLELAGLCRRRPHPSDARATLVEITAQGRRTFDRAVERLNTEVFEAIGLSDVELEMLVELIGRLRAADGDIVLGSEARSARPRPT